MPHPRYRVRTLLIATTLAAVVLACLAPWLRGMTESQLVWMGIRMLMIPVGALMERVGMLRRYRRLTRKELADHGGIEISTGRFKTEYGWWSVFCFLVAIAFFVEWSHFRMQSRATPGIIPSWFSGGWIAWFVVGTQLTRCLAGWIERRDPIYLTKTWLITPWVCWRLKVGMQYHWRDRLAGQFTVRHPPVARLELSIPPENVDEVDRILSHMLDPPKYRPPVVPPPPAT